MLPCSYPAVRTVAALLNTHFGNFVGVARQRYGLLNVDAARYRSHSAR